MIKQITGLFFGILVFLLSSTQVCAHPLITGFSDVSLTDWYAVHIHTLSDMDLVQGYCDSTFQPSANISKAEFIVMALKTQQHQFPAAQGEHWAMHYIREAERLGIIGSGEAAAMDLNEPITRAAAARILILAGSGNSSSETQDLTHAHLAISDYDTIPELYQPYVLQLFANGWVSGYPDGEFKPENYITRAEAAVMLVRSLGEVAEASIQKIREAVAEALEESLLRQQDQALTVRKRILETAFKLLGTPYRFGGSTPSGFDCSGFVNYVLNKHGISIPRSSAAIYEAVEKIPFSELVPGDLVFFRGYQAGPSHVGIYTGNGEFIHAPASGRPVSFDRIDDPSYWAPRQIGAGRVL